LEGASERAVLSQLLLGGKKQVHLLMVTAAAVLLVAGCAHRSDFREVRFSAPSRPDPRLSPYLSDVARLGVICTTEIKPFAELDTEKVLARLGNAIARHLDNLPDVAVVTQDEIIWRIKSIEMDSTEVISEATRLAMIDTMQLDALVVIELQRLQARSTPVMSGSRGMTSESGLDLAVDLRMSLVNLRNQRIWQQSGQQRQWQPIRVQLHGRNQGEQQLLVALGRPLQGFLRRISPPPSLQEREFELRGR
jgi:hypothetical protein